MNANEHITISKRNALPPSQDYYALREEGIQLIQQLGSKLWTDYNIHDPGITILETLCYVITDLSYRSSFSVKDLIAEDKPELFNPDLQALFTAREILTTAPWTITDYRKLLIDLEGIRNAWVKCSKCNCGPKIYVDCKKSELTYEVPVPPEKPEDHEVIPKGLYDILLELDADEQSGDLNTGKISLSYNMLVDGEAETLYFEVRFPSLNAFNELQKTEPKLKLFRDSQTIITGVNAQVISNQKNAVSDIDPTRFVGALRGVMYVTFQISFDELVTDPTLATAQTITFKDVPIRLVLLKNEVRRKLTITDLRTVLEENSTVGVAGKYLQKIIAADKAVDMAMDALQSHRNITEDFCCVEQIEVEEIGVCFDMELKPDADIEQVLGEAYYLIEEYFNPTIKFYRLGEMLERKTVDEIFDGPKLLHGFIEDEDIEKSVLNRTLYASDIINLLMDIPGVVSIKNFALVRFDKEGNNAGSDAWKLQVTTDHLPRLYLEGSKILVFKNGLPFLPDTAELMDTMHVVRGRNMMPKLKDHDLDLDVPVGTYYPMQEYWPVQNSLPLVYGTGYEGLPSTATELRKAQAKQLKAYLIFFEQLLVNYVGQLANLKYLFSIDNSITKTYFPVLLQDAVVTDVSDLYNGLDALKLQELTETKDEFVARRNRFLDHLLARFSESFSEYALLLYSYKAQKAVTAENLIHIKTSFLKQFPYQSAYKAQSFDYTVKDDICLHKDLSGIHHRISALLGTQTYLNFFEYNIQKEDDMFTASLALEDKDGNVLLVSTATLEKEDRNDVIYEINFEIERMLSLIAHEINYSIIPVGTEFIIGLGTPAIAVTEDKFASIFDAQNKIYEIIEFAQMYLGGGRVSSLLKFFEFEIQDLGTDYTSTLELTDDKGNTLLTSTEDFTHTNREDVVQELHDHIALLTTMVTDKTAYAVVPDGAEFVIELGSPALARSDIKYATEVEAWQQIEVIIEFAKKHVGGDRFIIVEHILLRPQENGDALLPICVESDCKFCGDEDPYSYRVTFVFDGESELALNHFDYRRFAEKTIRAELPAHVLAKICWVEHDVFVAFEAAYCAWLSATEADRQVRLEELIDVFKELKSIYPPPTLHDCIDGNDENRVFLNQTQL